MKCTCVQHPTVLGRFNKKEEQFKISLYLLAEDFLNRHFGKYSRENLASWNFSPSRSACNNQLIKLQIKFHQSLPLSLSSVTLVLNSFLYTSFAGSDVSTFSTHLRHLCSHSLHRNNSHCNILSGYLNILSGYLNLQTKAFEAKQLNMHTLRLTDIQLTS